MPRRDTVAKRRRGRPSGLTPERAEHIAALLRAGNAVNTACAMAGVTTSMYYRWMHRAERAEYSMEHGQPWDRSDEAFRDFRDTVLAARATAAETMVEVVMRAAIGGKLSRNGQRWMALATPSATKVDA